MSDKIEISKDGYINLINKVLKNKIEERELCLDRYRRADVMMENENGFILAGKNAVSFLVLAANCSNEMSKIAHEIKSIVYKDEVAGGSSSAFNDDWKRKQVEELDKEEE